jgi:integrase
MNIPKKYQKSGLHIYCNKCKKYMTKNYSCEHKESWKYKIKIHIPGTQSKSRSKTCKSSDIEGAMVELHEFNKEFKNVNRKITLKKGGTLIVGVQRYLQMIHREGEFSRNPKSLDPIHVKDCLRVIDRFIQSLKNSGKKPDSMLLSDLDERVIAPFKELVDKIIRSTAARDRHTRIMRSFINFLTNRGMYKGANFFKSVATSNIQPSPIAINQDEFKKIISAINEGNSWGIKGSSRKKNYYRQWFKDLIILSRYTGLRKEEIYNLKWSDIITVKGNFRLLIVHNLKVERLLDKDDILKVVPVTKKLGEILDRLEKNPFKTDSKILDTGMTWKAYRDFVSRAFTHFYKVAMPEVEHKVFNQLRKSQITDIQSILGEDAHLISGHSNNSVISKHYVDKIQAAIKLLELEE